MLSARPGCAKEMPNVSKGMLRPEYWINRATDPDRVFMSEWDIMRINSLISRQGYRTDPHEESPWVSGRRIRGYIEEDHRDLSGWRKYDQEDRRLRDPAFARKMRALTRDDRVPEHVRVRYGLTVRRVKVRMMPTDAPVQRRPGEPNFDILMKSVAEPGEPVALYHFSADGKWAFVQTPHCCGWVLTAGMCWAGDREPFRKYLNPGRFLVVTGRESRVYRDRGLDRLAAKIGMGGRMPLVREERGLYVVLMPSRLAGGRPGYYQGYVSRRGDLHEGFLKLTKRDLLIQAFKWLGGEYRWGYTGEATDCSGFIMSVFMTFGIELERSSELQVRAFEAIAMPRDMTRKERRLSEMLPFRTLLGFPGHIGLYLGKVGERHYLIHAFNSYWTGGKGGNREVRVGRVVVSDLSLGENGRNGSLLEKLQSASIID